jgi:hypothetical protein
LDNLFISSCVKYYTMQQTQGHCSQSTNLGRWTELWWHFNKLIPSQQITNYET